MYYVEEGRQMDMDPDRCKASNGNHHWVTANNGNSLYCTYCTALKGVEVDCSAIIEGRTEVLNQALAAVTKDRNLDYGNPEDNFATIAKFWEVYKPGYTFTPVDVAIMMDLVKTSRIMTSPKKIDHWVDKAGYSACGYRCAISD